MLSPIFAQQYASCSTIGPELRLALEWWLEALQHNLCETRLWRHIPLRAGCLLCDARSVPPRVAAVLCLDKRVFYSDWAPSPELVSLFKRRDDGQIMSLEILSVAFALSAFEEVISGRNIVVYSDNKGWPRGLC